MSSDRVAKLTKALLGIGMLLAAAVLMYRSWEDIAPPPLREGRAQVATSRPHLATPAPAADRLVRARRAQLPATPTVALLDIYVEGGTWRENRAAANFTEMLLSLLETPAVRWVERQDLRPAEQELGLLALMPDDPAAALRLGKWASADLVIRCAIVQRGTPQQHVRFEVVDLASADVVVRRELPLSGDADDGALDAVVAHNAAKIIEAALAEALKELRDRATSQVTTAAALFFKNTGQTDRLDFLEKQIVESLMSSGPAWCWRPGGAMSRSLSCC
jgi:hypothetical protein